jgi:secreted trypsin-like serine protease
MYLNTGGRTMRSGQLAFALATTLILLHVPGALAQANPPTSGQGAAGQAPPVSPFIVGGVPVNNISELPWQVALVDGDDSKRDQFCGGSLIAPNWVLTAAHCIDNFIVLLDPKRVDVIAGTIKYDAGGERMNVEKIIVHPQWGQPGAQNDFDAALLKLATPAKLGQPITLIPPSGSLPEGPNVRVSGWGALSEGGSGSNQLMRVDVPVVSNTECNKPESYDGRITAQMFCAGLREGGKDSCQGDSGGPVMSAISGSPQLVGVVSWGFGCARKLKYGVYTRVTTVSQWASDTMAGN